MDGTGKVDTSIVAASLYDIADEIYIDRSWTAAAAFPSDLGRCAGLRSADGKGMGQAINVCVALSSQRMDWRLQHDIRPCSVFDGRLAYVCVIVRGRCFCAASERNAP